MKLYGKFIISVTIAISLLYSCSDSGNSGVPLDFSDPSDAVTHIVDSKGNSSLRIDLFDNLVYVDDTMGMSGIDMRFASYGVCNGIGYMQEIPREGWRYRSEQLQQGKGYFASNIFDEGCCIAAVYVDNTDSLGNLSVKTLAPLYGTFGRFAVNTKKLDLKSYSGDTAIYLIHPTTYNVNLKSGKWLSVKPNVTYIELFFDANDTGSERRDVLYLNNGIFDDIEITVMQAAYDDEKEN